MQLLNYSLYERTKYKVTQFIMIKYVVDIFVLLLNETYRDRFKLTVLI